MKSILIAVILVSLLSVTVAQMDNLFNYMMLSNMMGARRGQGQGQGLGTTGQAGTRNLAAAAAAAAAARRGGGRNAGNFGLGSMLRGNRGLRLMAYSGQLGDTFRDLAYCDIAPQLCLMRLAGM